MYPIDGLSTSAVLGIGHAAGMQGNRNLQAFATITAAAVTKRKLKTVFDNDPPRHVTVVGWPSEKHEVILITQQLAADAVLHQI